MTPATLTSPADLGAWISRLFETPEMAKMGHCQRTADLNLGLGWVYYGLARLIRPARAVVIGSYRGFVPLVLGRALADNQEGGEVTFIDPSFVDEFWTDPDSVRHHFESFGVENIRHHLETTQSFVETDAYRDLGEIGILFVDGFHSLEQAQFDFEAFIDKLADNGIAIFHDSIRERSSGMYGQDKRYTHTVVRFINQLKTDPRYQVLDLMFGDGATLVRKAVPVPPRP